MTLMIEMDYKSPPVYVGKELYDEDLGISYRIANIVSVEVDGAITRVHFEYEEIIKTIFYTKL